MPEEAIVGADGPAARVAAGLLLLALGAPAQLASQSGWVRDSTIDRRTGTVARQVIASSLERTGPGMGPSALLVVSCGGDTLEVRLMSISGTLFRYDHWQPDVENDALLFIRRDTGLAVAETWPLYSPFSALVEGSAAIGLANDLARDTVFIVQNSSASDGEVATFRIRNRSVVAALVARCEARSRSP